MLFAGDLFEAVPFGTQPTVAVEAADEDGMHKHYVGQSSSPTGCSSARRAT
jgi:hypothetical protein